MKTRSLPGKRAAAFFAVASASFGIASPGHAQTARAQGGRWEQKAHQHGLSQFRKKAYRQIALLAVAPPRSDPRYGGLELLSMKVGSERPAATLVQMGLPVLPLLTEALDDQTPTHLITFGKTMRIGDKGKTWRVNELVALVLVGIAQHNFVVKDGNNSLTLNHDVGDHPKLVPLFQKQVLDWYSINKSRTVTERKIADVSDGWFRNRLDAVEWLGARKERQAVPALIRYANTVLTAKEKNSLQDTELAETALALGQIGNKASLPTVKQACDYLAYGLKRWGVMTSGTLNQVFQAYQGRALLGDKRGARQDLQALFAQCAGRMDEWERKDYRELLSKAKTWLN